jgi:hypothetical protein
VTSSQEVAVGGPAAAVVVEFPLRGEWVAVRTPAHKVPSHGTELFGQRYAFDFVRPDARKGLHLQPAGAVRSFLLGARTRDYYGWGQPVHGALDGRVVAAVDGVAERTRVQVVREVAVALRTTVGFDPARSGFAPLAGPTWSCRAPKPSRSSRTWLRGPCRSPRAGRSGSGS